MGKFIQVAHDAIRNLKREYGEFWTNPGAEIELAESKSEDADESDDWCTSRANIAQILFKRRISRYLTIQKKV